MPNSLALRDDIETTTLALQIEERAADIVVQLKSLKSSLVVNLLHMGDLLLEVKQNNYHLTLGYTDFQEWLDDAALDMKISQAYYLMRIVSKAAALEIPRPELEACNISALKEIASLSVDTQADKIRELVEYAKDHSAAETKEEVDKIKLAEGQELYTLKGFRVPVSVVENVIDPALEQFRLEYGQTIDSESGDVIEISDGKVLELIFVDWLNGHESMV